MQRSTANGVALFLCLMGVLSLHRLLAMSFLMGQLDTQKISTVTVLAIGLLSDIWVAGLFAALYLIIALLWSVAADLTTTRASERAIGGADPLAMLIFITVSLTASAHQNYVEFFHFQIMPFHFSYLSDGLFLASSWTMLRSVRGWLLCIAMGLFTLLWWRRRHLPPKVSHGLLVAFVGLPCLALAAHSSNLHLRVQRFIPTELQMNYFERLYYQWQLPVNPPLPGPQQMAALGGQLGTELTVSSLHKLLLPVSAATPFPLARTLASLMQERIQQNRRPLVLIVLAESLRPAETGFFHSDQALQSSLTPHIDAFARSGVAFLRAFSTSNVTRGGQEAVWCGHLAAVGTSMMRERPDITLGCLPQLLVSGQKSGVQQRPLSFFLHGGRGEFDSQEVFWRRRGVSFILTQSSFAPTAPVTSWGVSDIALMTRAIEELPQLVAKTPEQSFALGLILTVTNHIPWQLPADAPAAIAFRQATHPAQLTTAYTDEAFGQLITGLKERGLWENTLLILSSDHGTAVLPRYYPPHKNSPNRAQRDLTHIVLAIGGGLMESSLQHQGMHGGTILGNEVSQAAVAPFIAYITGNRSLSFATPMLLGGASWAPVMANLGSSLYFPAEDIAFAKEDIMKTSLDALGDAGQLPLTYARCYLNLLNHLHGLPALSQAGSRISF